MYKTRPEFHAKRARESRKIKSELNRTAGFVHHATMWPGSLLMGLGLALSLSSLDLEGT